MLFAVEVVAHLGVIVLERNGIWVADHFAIAHYPTSPLSILLFLKNKLHPTLIFVLQLLFYYHFIFWNLAFVLEEGLELFIAEFV